MTAEEAIKALRLLENTESIVATYEPGESGSNTTIRELKEACRMAIDALRTQRSPNAPRIGWMEGNEFPARLRRLRECRGMRQYIVSELCGLNRGTVRRYERGEMEPSTKALKAIADYFDVSVDYLLGRTSNPNVNK